MKVIKLIELPDDLYTYVAPKIMFRVIVNELIETLLNKIAESLTIGQSADAWERLKEVAIEKFPEFDVHKHIITFNHVSKMIEISEK